MRKIVQIETAVTHGFLGLDPVLIIYALCDDGTLWARQPWKKGDKWDQIESVPDGK